MKLRWSIPTAKPLVALTTPLVTVLFGFSQLWAAKYSMPSSRQPGQMSEVSVSFEASGWLSMRGKPLPRRLKMSVKSEQKYQQRLMELTVGPKQADGQHGERFRCRAVRHYDSIETEMVVAKHEMQPALRDDRRLIAVSVEDGAATTFSPTGPLTREELDLIQQPGDSAILVSAFNDVLPAAGDRSYRICDAVWHAELRIDNGHGISFLFLRFGDEGKSGL